jgi:phosphatidylserine decarboxylase
MLQSAADRSFILLQRVLPERLLGRCVFWLARSRVPWLKNLLIRQFIRLFRIDLSECIERDPAAYPSLNAFFTRALRPGARPLPGDAGAVVCPADGRLEAVGYADDAQLLQAKRFRYRVADLLVLTDDEAERYRDGATLTVYLAPHNYHRVHMPLAGYVRETVYVPGRRWAVNARTARRVPGLFAANERVVLHCENAAGRFAVVLVGALNVASISLAWAGEIAAPPGHGLRRWSHADAEPRLALAAGDLLGQFNLGSTVVFIAERNVVTWQAEISSGMDVLMGQSLGRLGAGPAASR